MRHSFLRSLVLGSVFLPLVFLRAQNANPPGGQAPPEQPREDSAAMRAALDGVPGYSGLTFGEKYSDVKESLVLEQDRGPLKLYKKKGENLHVGPVLLETVLYYFFDGKLYGIAFHTHDGQDSLNLLSIFHDAFGQGEEEANGGPSTLWIGKTTGAMFDLNTSTGDASAFIFNHTAHDAYLQYESDANAKAADELLKGK